MAMDENAMFKALLKNQPQQKPVTNEIKQAPAPAKPAAQPSRPPASPAKGSEDAMFRALLHNRPAPPAQKPQIKVEPAEPIHQAPQAANVQQEPVVITQVSPPPVITIEPVVDSINNLTATVNQLQNLMKTTVLPVIILILLIGIGILIKI